MLKKLEPRTPVTVKSFPVNQDVEGVLISIQPGPHSPLYTIRKEDGSYLSFYGCRDIDASVDPGYIGKHLSFRRLGTIITSKGNKKEVVEVYVHEQEDENPELGLQELDQPDFELAE